MDWTILFVGNDGISPRVSFAIQMVGVPRMIYTFKCLECNHIFEQSMTLSEYQLSNKIVGCPKCSSIITRRYFGNPLTIIYKDDGFTKYTQEEE